MKKNVILNAFLIFLTILLGFELAQLTRIYRTLAGIFVKSPENLFLLQNMTFATLIALLVGQIALLLLKNKKS